MDGFNCSRLLFEPATRRKPLGEQLDLAFADMDLVPLLVQENYLNHRPDMAGEAESCCVAGAASCHALLMRGTSSCHCYVGLVGSRAWPVV